MITKIDKLVCLDRLNIAWTRGFLISFSLRSSKIIILPVSYSWGNFICFILSYVFVCVGDFSKSLFLTIPSFTKSISSSFEIFGLMWIGIKLLKTFN